MKNKIKQFSKGDFKVEQPDICFSETQIFITVGEGEIFEGSFLIENRKDGNIRGLVYPSSFRMHCLEEGFEGNPVKVNFSYDSTGLLPGHVEQGKFTVVCNGGEYDLDFTAIVEKPFVMTKYGKVQSLADFRRLASQDFLEAKALFRTRQFYDVLKYEDIRICNLYANVRKWSLDEQALEEFLVGIKQKEKIFLVSSEQKVEIQDVLEDQKCCLNLTKNTWGYVPIHIDSNEEFIIITRKDISTDDFVGNNYRLEYRINATKLHAGYNFGQISVSTPYEILNIEVAVHQNGVRDEMRGMKGMVAGRGLKDYLGFVSGKISVDDWVEKATKRVNQLRELEPDNEYYPLLQAHIYLRGRREEEAKWILENGNHGRFVIGRKPEINAYYMFLTALLKKDTLHTNRVLEEINRIYMKHPYTWQLLCMIINLDTKYRDYNDRLRVLERQFFNGANHILLYAEAYICFQERVILLRKLESFEIQIMNFATKYKLITRDLAVHFADLVCRQKRFDAKLLRILQRVYEMYDESLILKAICIQLILGDKTGQEYFKWYEAAVKQEMRIAQLYEYYMMSLEPRKHKKAFPRIVYLYFSHGINLDYRRTSYLYENILTYESENEEIYKLYKEQMKNFAKDHLLKRHIDDSLRVIYNRFINPNSITLDELDALYDLCHAYQVTTDEKGIKYVLVIEKDGSIRQRLPYKTGRGTVIYLYDKESRIVFEADNGRYYTDSVTYEVRRLFHERRYDEVCKNRSTRLQESEVREKMIQLSFDNLKQYGIEKFDKQEVFLLCTKHIREQEKVEDDFILYLSFELLKEDLYDKAVLNYLSQFYCGATRNMKFLWVKAKEYGVNTKSLAERIITQMLFSEVVFDEEEIFEDYYAGRPYFRLKQAYLAYVAKMYVVKNRQISEAMIRIIIQELMQKEYLADICKVAVLKYYAGKNIESAVQNMLKECFLEMCEKQMVFAFYMNYPEEWLREVQLYDKVLVEYCSSIEGKVKMFYRVRSNEYASGDYHSETLLPVFDKLFVKEFVLYEGETLDYYFEETNQTQQKTTEKQTYSKNTIIYEQGKFGRLNLIARLSKEKQYEAMVNYKQEEQLAQELFPVF